MRNQLMPQIEFENCALPAARTIFIGGGLNLDAARQLVAAFVEEFRQTNSEALRLGFWRNQATEFIRGRGPIAITSILFLVSAGSVLIYLSRRKDKKYRTFLAAAELCALVSIFLPSMLPFQSIRFFAGLLSFVGFMTLHRRVFSIDDSDDGLIGNILATFSCDLRQRLVVSAPLSFPPLPRLFFGITTILLMDLMLFMAKEWVPQHIHDPNAQYIGGAFFIGLWVMCGMDWWYFNAVMFMDILGYPCPDDLKHRNPVISVSLSEFWGARWNPIIGRLLQAAFYKPLRRMGCSRPFCVIGCFIGSAALHTVPLYFSTYSLSDAMMMASFFTSHGVLVLLEQVYFKLTSQLAFVRSISSDHLTAALEEAVHTAIKKEKKTDISQVSGFHVHADDPPAISVGGMEPEKPPVAAEPSKSTNATTTATATTDTNIKKTFIHRHSITTSKIPVPLVSSAFNATSGYKYFFWYAIEWIGEKLLLGSVCVTLLCVWTMTGGDEEEVGQEVHVNVAAVKYLVPVTMVGLLLVLVSHLQAVAAGECTPASATTAATATATGNVHTKKNSETTTTGGGAVNKEKRRTGTSGTGVEGEEEEGEEEEGVDVDIEKEEAILNDSSSIHNNMSVANGIVIRLGRIVYILLGWFWTITLIITTLPLFAVPVDHACSDMFSQSILVGPLIRTLQKAAR